MKTIRPIFAMNPLRVAVCLALFAVACASAFAQSAQNSTKPITLKGLEDAIKIGGLQDSELIAQIQSRGVDFVLTPQISDALRGLGASPAIIQAVGANYRGTPAPNVNPVAPPPPPMVPTVPTPSHAAGYPSAPGIYFKQANAWTRLQQESVAWHNEKLTSGLKKFSGGLIKTEATGDMPGAHSATTVHDPASFLIWPASGLTISNYLIVHLHGKSGDREFKISVGQLHSADQVDFRPAKVSNNLFEVDFSQGEGDYAFVTSRDVPTGQNSPDSFLFTFQIVP